MCAAVMAIATGAAHADPAGAPLPNGTCPNLYVVGVQGTTESGPAADSLAITGMIGRVFGPMLAESGGANIGHATVPYFASFGGAPGTGPSAEPFATSATQAAARLAATAAGVAAECPSTKLAVVGFSQGAGVAADFSRKEGAGDGPVPSDRIAGVALLSDFTRSRGAEQIPGRPGQTTPDPPPGTDAVAMSQVRIAPVPDSGGIDADAKTFGKLNGRVAQFCNDNDPACDAPQHADLLRTGAELAAQADLRNPISAVQSLGAVAAAAVTKASAAVVLNDVRVDHGQVQFFPAESVSHRLADAADPRVSMPSPEQQQRVSTTMGQAAAAIVADPLGQIPRLAGQIGTAIGAALADNADLINPGTWIRYASAVTSHDSYAENGATSQVAQWFSAMARTQAGRQRK